MLFARKMGLDIADVIMVILRCLTVKVASFGTKLV